MKYIHRESENLTELKSDDLDAVTDTINQINKMFRHNPLQRNMNRRIGVLVEEKLSDKTITLHQAAHIIFSTGFTEYNSDYQRKMPMDESQFRTPFTRYLRSRRAEVDE
jgi:hypothetical protein